jgi:hypothetical protein
MLVTTRSSASVGTDSAKSETEAGETVNNPKRITIEQEGLAPNVLEFSEVHDFSVKHDIHEATSTTLTVKGKLAGSPKAHEHEWKRDNFDAVFDEPGGIPHFGLVCECGAIACGNLEAGIVHHVREFGK